LVEVIIMRYRGLQSERGAVLIHVAVGLVALIGFSALTVDYGVLWVSRRQAQNAADAAAHAAAEQLSFGDPSDYTAATNAAVAAASQNLIWGQAPSATTVAITFLDGVSGRPLCPPGAPGPPDKCVKADVWRNAEKSNPLPTYFGQIVGLTQQGVKATATAQLYWGDKATCVKPFVIPDKWQENYPVPKAWDPTDNYDIYYPHPPYPVNTLITSPDVPDSYIAPSETSNGTGYSLPTDYGRQVVLKNGNPSGAIAPSFFHPVDFANPPCPNPTGGACYKQMIETCYADPIGPGTVLTDEPGDMKGPTKQGIDDLIALDPDASWNPSVPGSYPGTTGAPVGGCMADGSCTRSPRLVAVAAYDPYLYATGKTSGRLQVTVTHVLGFWIDSINATGDVTGYLCFYPTIAATNSELTPTADFLRTVIFVR
jgi:hypothetical protein